MIVIACVLASTTPGMAQKANADSAPAGTTTEKRNQEVPKASKPRSDAVRTLEDITIEGEIAVPQVLFITSRDFRRFRDGLGLEFRMTTLDVARSIDLPTRLRFVAQNKEETE